MPNNDDLCARCLHPRHEHYAGQSWGDETIDQCWARHPYVGPRCGCPVFVEEAKADAE